MPPLSGDPRVVIIGAGPCGLACARELNRLGHANWRLLERGPKAGGLASSVVDPAGFTWDLGGHVVFSHYGEFDRLLAEAMGEDILSHDRSSYVRFQDRWVPYPFQNNLRHLPEHVMNQCLSALAAAPGGHADMDFQTWMLATFGEGITHHFMKPYNQKVWATPPARMAAGWIAERVSVVDYERVLRNVRDGRDDVAWGPNNKFVFPARGGTGEIYTRLAARLGQRIRYDSEVVEIDPQRRTLVLREGRRYEYDALVSTMPLDQLVLRLRQCPSELREAASRLHHNSVYMVGVGYELPLSDEKSWMYFPAHEVPFYRATNFAKYSPANVPDGNIERYCSYMTETAYSPYRPQARSSLEKRVQDGLRGSEVVGTRTEVVSVHVENIEYAYPVPTLERDQCLKVIQPWLRGRAIFSRGRFGSWRYEVGNMDHAVKMGIDVARHLIHGESEQLIGD